MNQREPVSPHNWIDIPIEGTQIRPRKAPIRRDKTAANWYITYVMTYVIDCMVMWNHRFMLPLFYLYRLPLAIAQPSRAYVSLLRYRASEGVATAQVRVCVPYGSSKPPPPHQTVRGAFGSRRRRRAGHTPPFPFTRLDVPLPGSTINGRNRLTPNKAHAILYTGRYYYCLQFRGDTHVNRPTLWARTKDPKCIKTFPPLNGKQTRRCRYLIK